MASEVACVFADAALGAVRENASDRHTASGSGRIFIHGDENHVWPTQMPIRIGMKHVYPITVLVMLAITGCLMVASHLK